MELLANVFIIGSTILMIYSIIWNINMLFDTETPKIDKEINTRDLTDDEIKYYEAKILNELGKDLK